MIEAILDTDILSEVLKRKHPQVLTVARQYLIEHQRFAFSEMTIYEIIRGLKATHAILFGTGSADEDHQSIGTDFAPSE